MRRTPKPVCILARRTLLALAAVLALRGTEPEPRMPGLEADPGLAADGNPEPPLRPEPEERIEADPAWYPAATRREPAQGATATLCLTGMEYKDAIRMLEATLEAGQELPFFKSSRNDRVGEVKYFYHEEIFKPPIHHLTWGKHGCLFWLQGTTPAVKLLTPGGFHMGFPVGANRTLHYLGRNGKDELVYFGDVDCGVLQNRILGPRSKGAAKDFIWSSEKTPHPIRRVFPGRQGAFWVMGETALHHRHAGGAWGPSLAHGNGPGSFATSLAPCRFGGGIAAVRPDQDKVFVLSDAGTFTEIPLSEGSRPQAVAEGPNGQTWITLEGTDKYVIFDPVAKTANEMEMTPSASGPRGLRALTLGPDGNMWMVMARTGGLLRMSPDGDFVERALPKGDVPVELVPTADGLLFTLENSCRIGFIRVKPVDSGPPVQGTGSGPAAADWEESIREPRADREKKLTRAQAHALHEARIRRAEERQLARLAEEKAAQEERKAEAGAEERKEPGPRPPSPPSAQQLPADPLATLAGLGVCLTTGDVRHILTGHACGRNSGKSQFAQAHSTPEGITALLARGLAESGAIGRITDSRGRCYTKCELPGVGKYHTYGELAPADHFVVVTAPYFNEQLGDYEHGVVTAYPVHRHW